MFWGFALIILSIIAIPSLLLSKRPNAKELLEQIEPYQAWIGVLFCFWTVWGITFSLVNIELLTTFPLWWITLLAGNVIGAVLGFLLAFGLISDFFSSNLETENRAHLREKIAPILGKTGLLGLFMGAWMTAVSFLFL